MCFDKLTDNAEKKMMTYWHLLFLLVIGSSLSLCGQASSVLELFPEFKDLQLKAAEQSRKVAEQNKGIGFHVKLSSGSSMQTLGRAIKFGNIISNVGNNYKSSTGSFTAPFGGMYFFTTTMTSKALSVSFRMVKNDMTISECRIGNYENLMPSVTISAVVSLRKGDRVNARIYNTDTDLFSAWFSRSKVLDGPVSFFSGFLVSRDEL
uniref:Putative C1q domain containing protein MgC1q56 n=1 Tax=Mytilus galloprovincialis TaxID=29158 RepID=F0V493_MYTGA|nr:putative C1q domain containing protein MgC1q56 [Mytilus galloprovincialis]